MKIRFTKSDYAAIAAMLVYSASATVTPVCLLKMADELHFSLSASGGIEGMRSLLIFFFLFFGGFIAARIGKVKSLTGGLYTLCAGYAVYALAPSYAVILCASFVIGCAAGVLEGLLNPFIQDLHPDDSGRYLNMTNAFWSAGVLLTVLISGELLTHGVRWRLIMAFLSVCACAAAVFFSVVSKHSVHVPVFKSEQVVRQYIDCVRTKRFWVFAFMMILAGGSEGAFTFWSASYIQVHFAALPRMGGIGTACFAGGMLTMRFASGLLVTQDKLRRAIFFSAAGGIAVSLAVPFVQHAALFFPLLFLAGMSIACFWPSIQSYAVYKMPYLDSTAVFILLSCAGIPGFGLISLIMGIIGDRAGLQKSFFCVPILLSLLALTVVIERGKKRTK